MADFPRLPDDLMIQRLAPPTGKPVRAVLDTDTFNEVDDQFALAYALLSPEACRLEAVYAAPFNCGGNPARGMEQSYEEILRVLDKMGKTDTEGFVFKGSDRYLPGPGQCVNSPAARDLVEKAMASDDGPLYVLTIGAPTNVASALLMEPSIVERIVIVWLGGQPLYWPTAREHNLQQDIPASQLMFDSGAPHVLIPCANVSEHLRTTVPELDRWLRRTGPLGDYLCDIVAAYHEDHFAWSKVIWDISAVAWLIAPEWVPTNIVHAPILTDRATYSIDERRHFMRVAVHVERDTVFRDLFTKFTRFGASGSCLGG
ncbi:MAG: nucleoside hydrolase [Kiritimatiellaeota bacterium]|nr:nucleoside hydrolase [Kiritimatiellota bacterium]